MLFCTEEITCASDFQVTHGNFESASQFRKFPDRIQPFFRCFGKDFPPAVEKPCTRYFFRAAYASPHLIDLRQSQLIRIINEHRVCVRLVHTIFNNRGTKKNIIFLLEEIHHDFLQCSAVHLPVSNGNRHIRRQNIPQMGFHRPYTFYTVVNKIGLSAACLFMENGIFHNGVIVLCHISLYRMAVRRRLCHRHHIPHTGKTHMECTGNRCRRESKDIQLL